MYYHQFSKMKIENFPKRKKKAICLQFLVVSNINHDYLLRMRDNTYLSADRAPRLVKNSHS